MCKCVKKSARGEKVGRHPEKEKKKNVSDKKKRTKQIGPGEAEAEAEAEGPFIFISLSLHIYYRAVLSVLTFRFASFPFPTLHWAKETVTNWR